MTRDEDDATIPIMNNNSNIMQTKIQRKGHKQQQQQQQQHQHPRPTHGRVKLEEEPGAGECLTNPEIASSTTAATVPSTLPSTLPSNSSNPASPSRSTNLDGIGLWNSFTRNFATPIQAIFDLLDNSFDAAPSSLQDGNSNGNGNGNINGHIHIETDLDDEREARGVVILNNCSEPIGSLKHALTLFKSSKGEKSHMDKIGENGIGVKQGCATLSDLSFIISRDGYRFGLGIIAKDLQTRNGVHFPSFSFEWNENENDNDNDNSNETPLVDCLEAELQNIFSHHHDPKLYAIIQKYGEGCAHRGIMELVKQYMKICSSSIWNAEGVNHVFGLVIYDLKHGREEDDDEHGDGDGYADENYETDNVDKTQQFLDQLRIELPKHYLHVPTSFDVRVAGRKVHFAHWQNRLAEMTHFTIRVHKKVQLDAGNFNVNVNVNGNQKKKYIAPARARVRAPVHSRVRASNRSRENDAYDLDVYLGFDVIRCLRRASTKCAKLVYHSRRTGRLIKEYRDARGELLLSAGGTDFCQGLTIIVDDKHGMLPLNPTKQDFAFGEEKYGEVHQSNIKLWLSATAKAYYTFFKNQCGGKKTKLTEKVVELKSRAFELQSQEGTCIQKSIEECKLSTFRGLEWKYRQAAKSIALKNLKNISIVRGCEELMRLAPDVDDDDDDDDGDAHNDFTSDRDQLPLGVTSPVARLPEEDYGPDLNAQMDMQPDIPVSHPINQQQRNQNTDWMRINRRVRQRADAEPRANSSVSTQPQPKRNIQVPRQRNQHRHINSSNQGDVMSVSTYAVKTQQNDTQTQVATITRTPSFASEHSIESKTINRGRKRPRLLDEETQRAAKAYHEPRIKELEAKLIAKQAFSDTMVNRYRMLVHSHNHSREKKEKEYLQMIKKEKEKAYGVLSSTTKRYEHKLKERDLAIKDLCARMEVGRDTHTGETQEIEHKNQGAQNELKFEITGLKEELHKSEILRLQMAETNLMGDTMLTSIREEYSQYKTCCAQKIEELKTKVKAKQGLIENMATRLNVVMHSVEEGKEKLVSFKKEAQSAHESTIGKLKEDLKLGESAISKLKERDVAIEALRAEMEACKETHKREVENMATRINVLLHNVEEGKEKLVSYKKEAQSAHESTIRKLKEELKEHGFTINKLHKEKQESIEMHLKQTLHVESKNKTTQNKLESAISKLKERDVAIETLRAEVEACKETHKREVENMAARINVLLHNVEEGKKKLVSYKKEAQSAHESTIRKLKEELKEHGIIINKLHNEKQESIEMHLKQTLHVESKNKTTQNKLESAISKLKERDVALEALRAEVEACKETHKREAILCKNENKDIHDKLKLQIKTMEESLKGRGIKVAALITQMDQIKEDQAQIEALVDLEKGKNERLQIRKFEKEIEKRNVVETELNKLQNEFKYKLRERDLAVDALRSEKNEMALRIQLLQGKVQKANTVTNKGLHIKSMLKKFKLDKGLTE